MSVTTKGYQSGVKAVQKFDKAERDPEKLIVTPLYEEWLVEHPEATTNPEIFDRVMRELLIPQRDRSRSFSASSAGFCKRRQELAFLGMPKLRPEQVMDSAVDPKTVSDQARGIRIFQNGTFFHLRTQVALLSAGIIDDIEYLVERSIFSQPVRASLDGIGIARRGVYKGLRFGLELKGRMSFSYASQERSLSPDAKTRKQIAMQMFLAGYDVWVVFNENKDTQDIGEFVIERDEEEVADAKEELTELTRAIKRMKLHPVIPECVKENKTGEFYKCPYGTAAGVCKAVGVWP